jgi:hypothetical protein
VPDEQEKPPAAQYIVFVDDNFHHADESERYKLGNFTDCEFAVAACKRIVDEFLNSSEKGRTAKQLFETYRAMGEDPWIQTSDPQCAFSAWTYAEQRCREIASE